MAEVNFPGNRMYSNNNDQNEKKLDAVISRDSIVSTKKPALERIKEAFLGADGFDIVDDVVIPGLQNLVLDVLEMKFFHQVGRRNPPYNNYSQPTYVDYTQSYYGYTGNSSYKGNTYGNQNRRPDQNRVDYKNIILRTREDAERVVVQMRDTIRATGSISVAQFFDLLQLTGEYTDNNWGWTDGSRFGIQRVAQGFLIVLPNAYPLQMID